MYELNGFLLRIVNWFTSNNDTTINSESHSAWASGWANDNCTEVKVDKQLNLNKDPNAIET